MMCAGSVSGSDLLGEPDGLDQPERLVVEPDGARVVDELVEGPRTTARRP
jgi:hypothetical protein